MEQEAESEDMKSLSLTPTWSVAVVLAIFVVVSLLVERAIHRLSTWLQKTNRKPLYEAVEKIKEDIEETESEHVSVKSRKLLMGSIFHPTIRRILNAGMNRTTCTKIQLRTRMKWQFKMKLHSSSCLQSI